MEDIFRVLFQAINASSMNYVYVLGAAGLFMAVFWNGKYGREIECGGWFTFLVATWTCVVTGILLFSLDKLVAYADLIWTQSGSPVLVQAIDLAVLAGFVLLGGLGFSLPILFTRGGAVTIVAIIAFSALPYYLGLSFGPGGLWAGVALAMGTPVITLMVAFPDLRPHRHKGLQTLAVRGLENEFPSSNAESKAASRDQVNPLPAFELEAAQNPAVAETAIIRDCTRLQADWVTPRLGGRVITLLGQGHARAAFAISYFLWNHYFRRLPGFEPVPEEVDLPTLCGRVLAQLPSARIDRTRDTVAELFEGLVRVTRVTTQYLANILQDSRTAARQVRQVHTDLGNIHLAVLEWYEEALGCRAS